MSMQEIGIGIAVAPFISFLESIAIAKAFGKHCPVTWYAQP